MKEQECIPVGCVPSAAVAVSRGGCTWFWGGTWSGGYLVPAGCTWSGGCTWSRGVYLVQGGVPGLGVGVPGLGGVPGPGGCTWSQGVYLVWGVYLVLGGVPGPVGCTWSWGVYLVRGGLHGQVLPLCGQTDACKNITFATSLRTVISQPETQFHHVNIST